MPQIDLDPLAGEEGGVESHRLAAFWREQIEIMNKEKKFLQFIKRGHKIEARYRDERNKVDEDSRRRYSSLWANVEILKPAIYGRTPLPVAERKFGDKDPVARGAAQILERALRNEIEICGFHDSLNQAVNDYLLPGRGTIWVRYEPQFSAGTSLHGENSIDMKDTQGEIEPEEIEQDEEGLNVEGEKLEETNDEIVRESTPVDYIHWEDFLYFPVHARTWSEVVGVGKRVYMTYTQMAERFGRDIAKKIPLQKDERKKDRFEETNLTQEEKGEVYEIWNKQDRTVYWVAEGYSYLLDRKDDPLNLEHFFPTPRPIIANQTNGTLIPVGDYIEYQDQATQIDELSQRIAMLTRACKVAGVYNSASKGIQRLLNESVENELIPVDDWAAFAEKGGIPNQVSFLPLKEIIGVINELVTLKEKQIEEMDRLTGINDLMRGTTDARETLGGQRLKSNYTGTRLTARQNEVARFARDTVRIMADIMCQHFSPQSLVEASGAMFEEGLGVDLEYVQNEQAATAPPPQQPPHPAMPGQAPGQPPQMGAPPPPMQGGPQAPQGPNVVPFPQRPGMMPGQMQVAPQPPQAPPVAPGLPAPPPPNPMQVAVQQAVQRIQAAIGLLRDERMRGFRVDIEVDSTIYGDAAQEKGDRTEFIGEVTKYLQTAAMLSAQVPEMTPLLGKLLQFGVRGFRVGRDLEASIEDFCDQAVKIAKAKQAAAASQPNPEQIKANAQAQQAQATAHAATVRSQADVMKSQGAIQESKVQQQTEQMKAQAEMGANVMEAQADKQNNEADIYMKQIDVRMREMEMQMEAMRAHAQMNAPQPPPQAGGLGDNGPPKKGIA